MPKDKKIKMNSKLKILKKRTEDWKKKSTTTRMKWNKRKLQYMNRLSLMI